MANFSRWKCVRGMAVSCRRGICGGARRSRRRGGEPAYQRCLQVDQLRDSRGVFHLAVLEEAGAMVPEKRGEDQRGNQFLGAGESGSRTEAARSGKQAGQFAERNGEAARGISAGIGGRGAEDSRGDAERSAEGGGGGEGGD